MKIKKIVTLFFVLILILCGCSNQPIPMKPTQMKVDSNEVNLFVNSERDLNDIVTIRFEPKNTTERDVTWSCETNDVITLNGSKIKANKVGRAKVTAIANANKTLQVSININVTDPNVEYYTVTSSKGDGYKVEGLAEKYIEGDEVSFTVLISDETKEINKVLANDDLLTPIIDNNYKFIMPGKDVNISVYLKDIITNVPAQSVTLSMTSLEMKLGDEAKVVTATVNPIDTTDTPVWTIVEGTNVVSIVSNNNVASITALAIGVATVKVSYNSSVFAECIITVKEASSPATGSYVYNIKYDLGTRQTSKELTTEAEVFETFEYVGDGEGIISAVTQKERIYGGGYGGKNETKWVANDMLKFGTTSVIGSLTLSLRSSVNCIKITGYVSDTSCKIKAGDSASLDWSDGEKDNKTTEVSCSDMSIANKETVEGKQMTTIVIYFENTDSLRIEVTNKKPLYITSIEFLNAERPN